MLNVDRLIKYKIYRAKQRDKKSNRSFNEGDYIDLEWALNDIKSNDEHCPFCGVKLKFFHNKNGDLEQFSINIKDINLAHLKNNSIITCLRCNLKRKRKHRMHMRFYYDKDRLIDRKRYKGSKSRMNEPINIKSGKHFLDTEDIFF